MAVERVTQLPPALKRESARTAKALLAAERRTLDALLATVSRTNERTAASFGAIHSADVEHVKAMAISETHRAVDGLADDLEADIAEARMGAREDSRARTYAEIAAVLWLMRRDSTAKADREPAERRRANHDDLSARSTGQSLASRWGRMVLGTILHWAHNDNGRAALVQATREIERRIKPRVRLIATTETSQAFSDERNAVVKDMAAEDAAALKARETIFEPSVQPDNAATYREAGAVPYEAWQTLLGRRWDAQLDNRVCAWCRSRDGWVVSVGETWGGEVPGDPHPGCRCFETFVPIATLIREAA